MPAGAGYQSTAQPGPRVRIARHRSSSVGIARFFFAIASSFGAALGASELPPDLLLDLRQRTLAERVNRLRLALPEPPPAD